MSEGRPTWFQRFLLPGFAFKAVVIGGGYATGRELAEFFMPSGPWGGVFGMILAMAIWSAVCAVTFLFAYRTHSFDYRTFFHKLLGPFWVVFEATYLLFLVLILAVFSAAAGEIAAATFGLPPLVGTLALVGSIIGITMFGNEGAERLFKYASFFLYGVYVIFVVLAFYNFGGRIGDNFALDVPTTGWAMGGLTYAGYNVIGAVIILPVLRHLTSARDAVTAGTFSGVLGMLPALLFFICMAAFYPEIADETLPSDFMLSRLGVPVFHYAFQIMIFIALLETSVGTVNGFNERIAKARKKDGAPVSFGKGPRLLVAVIMLVFSVFLADRFGFVALIAQGYRALAYVILAVFVVPLMTYGVWLLMQRGRADKTAAT